jgi:Fe-S oxidoreductase
MGERISATLVQEFHPRHLVPAVRETAADTLIVAADTSCREQIKHGADRNALHPAEVLRAALA